MGSRTFGRKRLGAVVGTLLAAVATQAAPLPMLSADGPRLVDLAGKPVVLKGCNLGNWLILESWMFGGTLLVDGKPFKDQAALYAKMDERFGRDKREALMDAFRAAYVTPRDFDAIKAFGFNAVRLPFDYRALQDDARPTELRPDAFAWLDQAIKMAEDAGVYVILDMHGVPGGQSKQDHTGESDQNKLYASPEHQDRTVLLWTKLAERYKDRASVAAYDLINEPYGNYAQDVRPVLAKLLPRIAKAVRSTGDRHVMYFPGALNGGIAFYGDPNADGLTGIGFTEHYYPGLFGSKPALETHARLLGAELPAKRAYVEKTKTPYLVGEFNVVLASEAPNELMRLYYDRFAAYGWAGTMWSYKLLKTDAGAAPSAWYMVTNGDALPKVDVATASADEIEAFFKGLAANPLAVSQPLKDALTAKAPPTLPLAKYAPLATKAPTGPQSNFPGFTSLDIGGAAPGHTQYDAKAEKLTVVAGGTDINAAADSFRFISTDKPAPFAGEGTGIFRATITELADSDQYAKAGVMARWGTEPGSPMVMLNVFPDGTLALIHRQDANGPTRETKVASGLALPVQLGLQIRDGQAVATYRTVNDNQAWKQAGTVATAGAPFRLGVAVCSHSDQAMTKATALLWGSSDKALLPADAADRRPATNLLVNGSFEQPGDSPDQCRAWNRWGDWINHEAGWTPTRDGSGLVGYHHWQIEGPGSSGMWQDVKVTPGRRYTFAVYAQHDAAGPGKTDAATVELRLEGVRPAGEPVTLNTRDFAVATTGTGRAWTRLSVSGTAISDTVRVLMVCGASPTGPRGGAVKLDAATLMPADDGR